MSLLAKCAAIAKAIGLPPDMAAGETLVAACEAMGIVPEPGATLPQKADKLMADIGCGLAAAPPPPAPTPAPAPALALAPARQKSAAEPASRSGSGRKEKASASAGKQPAASATKAQDIRKMGRWRASRSS